MTTLRATRRVQFCAGHRVYQHESKCRNMHGHNYVAFFEAEGDLDSVGRVVDFGVLKEKLGGWVERWWDHGFIVYANDHAACSALSRIDDQKVWLATWNPTAENMAAHLLNVVAPDVLQGTGVRVVRVVLWETENCYAEASL